MTNDGPNNDEKEVESSSSSSGKDDSGGGYSADCSASDQSLDGKNNPNSQIPGPRRSCFVKASQLTQDASSTSERMLPSSELHGSWKSEDCSDWEDLERMELDRRPQDDDNSPIVQQGGTGVDASSTLTYAQWNGIAISNPLDSRIDFTTLAIATATYASMHLDQQRQKEERLLGHSQYADRKMQAAGLNVNTTGLSQVPDGGLNRQNEATMVSLESYASLLEAVRPFFFPKGPVMQPSANENEERKTEQNNLSEQTSEGFTSFFTTTDSNTGASKTPTSSEEDKKGARLDSQPHDDDASSLVVLVRPKRRHQGGYSDSSRELPFQDQNDDSAVPDPLRQPTNPVNITDAQTSSSGTPQESSASAHASSGSGNDATGSGNYQKGEGERSSEEVATDQTTNEQDDSVEPLSKLAGLTHHKHAEQQQIDERQQVLPPSDQQHRKRQDKKRKRIEMRREYEAQQQFESSESSDSHKGKFLRPGKPMTLDEAMIFSDIPRILVQSHPPFMVVHTNAAFSRMTGIDSHFVVGRPVSRLFSCCDESICHREESLKGRKTNHDNDCKHIQDVEGQVQQPEEPFSLEAFLTSCGNCEVQTIKVNTVVEHMVGRNLILNGPSDKASCADKKQVSPHSDHSDATHMLCRAGVAPIMSAVNAVSLSTHHLVKNKRFKHDESNLNPWRMPDSQVVSHYIVHLEPKNNSMVFQKGGADSISSNSTQTLHDRDANLLNSSHSSNSSKATEIVAVG